MGDMDDRDDSDLDLTEAEFDALWEQGEPVELVEHPDYEAWSQMESEPLLLTVAFSHSGVNAEIVFHPTISASDEVHTAREEVSA